MTRTRLAVMAASALVAAACYEPSGLTYPEQVVGRVVIEADSVTVQVGKEVTVGVGVYDMTGRPMSASLAQWAIQDPRIATVADGVIKGISEGRTIVSVRAGSAVTGVRVRVEP